MRVCSLPQVALDDELNDLKGSYIKPTNKGHFTCRLTPPVFGLHLLKEESIYLLNSPIFSQTSLQLFWSATFC